MSVATRRFIAKNCPGSIFFGLTMTKAVTKRAARTKRETITVLGYSLLSLLARKKRTGYELSRFTAGARSMIFSSSGHSNIYKELAKLFHRKLVAFRVVKDERPFDKKLYSLTASGRETLLQWVKAEPIRTERTELNVRLHAIWLLTPAEAGTLLDNYIAIAKQEIHLLEEHRNYLREENSIKAPPPSHPLFGTFSNINLETENRRLMIKWCKWIQEQYSVPSKAAHKLHANE